MHSSLLESDLLLKSICGIFIDPAIKFFLKRKPVRGSKTTLQQNPQE